MAHPDRRLPPISLHRRYRRGPRLSPLWRRHPRASSELGLSRVLGRFLSGSALVDRNRPSSRLGERPEPHVWPSTRRARPRISVGCHDSVSRLVSRRRHLPNLRTQLAGSQQYWGIQHLLADYLGQGFDSSLGTHTAFPAPVESRPISSGLFQPNRASQRDRLPGASSALPTTRNAHSLYHLDIRRWITTRETRST